MKTKKIRNVTRSIYFPLMIKSPMSRNDLAKWHHPRALTKGSASFNSILEVVKCTVIRLR